MSLSVNNDSISFAPISYIEPNPIIIAPKNSQDIRATPPSSRAKAEAPSFVRTTIDKAEEIFSATTFPDFFSEESSSSSLGEKFTFSASTPFKYVDDAGNLVYLEDEED
ncbi:MAG TPA: hypothetical protein VGJ00_03025, partial [Rhabdochlamydiaceae bacterium]